MGKTSKAQASNKHAAFCAEECRWHCHWFRSTRRIQRIQRIQWSVRPAVGLPANLCDYNKLDVNCSQITFIEIRKAIAHLKSGKACGADDVPSEFWKAVCLPGTPANDWIMQLCFLIWSHKQMPDSWHHDRICAIFARIGQPLV